MFLSAAAVLTPSSRSQWWTDKTVLLLSDPDPLDIVTGCGAVVVLVSSG